MARRRGGVSDRGSYVSRSSFRHIRVPSSFLDTQVALAGRPILMRTPKNSPLHPSPQEHMISWHILGALPRLSSPDSSDRLNPSLSSPPISPSRHTRVTGVCNSASSGNLEISCWFFSVLTLRQAGNLIPVVLGCVPCREGPQFRQCRQPSTASFSIPPRSPAPTGPQEQGQSTTDPPRGGLPQKLAVRSNIYL